METRDIGLVNNNGEKIMIPAINEHQIKTCFSFARLTIRFHVVCIIAAASSNPKAVSGIELNLLFPGCHLERSEATLCQSREAFRCAQHDIDVSLFSLHYANRICIMSMFVFIIPLKDRLQHRSRQHQNQGEKEQSRALWKFSRAIVS